MNPKVDVYLKKAKTWQKELKQLRSLLLGCGLAEEFKWGKPCYTFQDANVVIVLPLKSYCALLFPKGALLKDPAGILVKAGENTQAARQIRLIDARQITEQEAVLKSYVRQAIEVQKAGLEVVYKKTTDYAVPDELQKALKESATLKAAFNALTPGRQRAYLIYFGSAKQSATREARIKKSTSQILKGKGWNEP